MNKKTEIDLCLFLLFFVLAVFEAVEKKTTTYGLVPFENSTFGTVVETLDNFGKTSVRVRAETYLTVSIIYYQ